MSDLSSALKAPSPGYTASSASTTSTEKMPTQPNTAPATTGKPRKIKYTPLRSISHHETLRYYRPGGYHPILIGDKLGDGDRFTVALKLGYGTFGTVWMCWDDKAMKLRAVKVMQAETSDDDFKKEVGILAELSKHDEEVSVDEAYKNHLAVPLEHFWQNGPNGRHLCIVMPVLGPNVMKAKALGDVDFLKDVCSQITAGLAFLHSKGMAHGDLHPGNVLLHTTLSDLGFDEIRPLLRMCNYEPLFAEGHDGSGPHAPKRIYESFNWAELDTKYIKKEVAIIDFGTSFQATDPPNHQTIDASLRAPEQFFGIHPSQASDLWALGCTLMHTLGCLNPFGRNPKIKTWSPLPSWEDALGPLPEPYRAKYIASKGADRKRKYDEMNASEPVSLSAEQLAKVKKLRREHSGTEDKIFACLAELTSVRIPVSEQQKQRRDKTEDSEASSGDGNSDSEPDEYRFWCLPREELDSAVSLVRSVFKYKPVDRTTAKDLLAHPFFTKHKSLPPPTLLASSSSSSKITAQRGPAQPPKQQGRPE